MSNRNHLIRKYDERKLRWQRIFVALVILFVIALLIFRFVAGISIVNGDSMLPTLQNGELTAYFRLVSDYDRGAADDAADVLRVLLAQVARDEHRDAHGQRSDHEGDQIEHLTARGYAGQARRRAEMTHDQQVHGAVGRLQHQGAQYGQHEQYHFLQDISLREIGFGTRQHNTFHLSENKYKISSSSK